MSEIKYFKTRQLARDAKKLLGDTKLRVLYQNGGWYLANPLALTPLTEQDFNVMETFNKGK